MYITGQELTISWKIMSEPEPPILSDFDVIVLRPDGTRADHFSAVYIDGDVPEPAENYTASFVFTPDVSGVWVVKLVEGVNNDYVISKVVKLTVHSPDTEIYQQIAIKSLDGTLAMLLAGTSVQLVSINTLGTVIQTLDSFPTSVGTTPILSTRTITSLANFSYWYFSANLDFKCLGLGWELWYTPP